MLRCSLLFARGPWWTPSRSGAWRGRLLSLALGAAGVLAGERHASADPEPMVLDEAPEATVALSGVESTRGADLLFSLGFEQTWKSSEVMRERSAALALPAVRVREDTSRLLLGSALGVVGGLSLSFDVPVVLAQTRALSPLMGSTSEAWAGAQGESLFSPSAESVRRSGVESLGVAASWGPTEAYWRPGLPRVRISAEGRFSPTEPMHAAVRGRSGPRFERFGAGISRGTTELRLRTMVSARARAAKPYFGLELDWQWAGPRSDFIRGVGAEALPSKRLMHLGVEVTTWELVERLQRISFELGLTVGQVARGQDYSVLFDALGASLADTYRRPAPTRYQANPDPASAGGVVSVADPQAAVYQPSGIETSGSYAVAGTALRLHWRAGRYVRFQVFGEAAVEQPRVLTLADPCVGRPPAAERAGPCVQSIGSGWRVLGAPNPAYRPEVHEPGYRFVLSQTFEGTVGAWATVLF